MLPMTMQPAKQHSFQYQPFSWQGEVVDLNVLLSAVAEAFSSLTAQQQHNVEFRFGCVSLLTDKHSESIMQGQVDLQIEAGVMANGHNALRLPERHLKPQDDVDFFFENLASALQMVRIETNKTAI